MAYISQDPNQQEDTSSTNVLASNPASNSQTTSQPATTNAPQVSTATQAPTYVSNGNPYGQYATPNQPSGSSASARKTTSGPSSGLQTNVQTYAQKNQASSQKLGTAVAGKLQNTSDIAKQNLANVEKKYSQGIESGSIANRNTAVNEATNAFNEASTIQGPTRTFKENAATLYNPTKTTEGAYSSEDQALVDSNKARVTYGDGSTKEFATAADAQNEIDTYNKSNPGYYTYGDERALSTSNDRLSEILNAEYKGPRDLNEIRGYNDTYNKIQDVSQLQNQALKSGSKEELLKRTFSAPTGEYNKGNRTLDDLLLGQGDAANTLKTTAEKLGSTPTGKIQDEFLARTKEARQQATQRSSEMDQIKDSARQALTETAAGRSKEVNDRIEGVVKDWDKYPTYFKEKFQQELDKHNIGSQKKQEYDSLAPQYNNLKNIVDAELPKKQAYEYLLSRGTLQVSPEIEKFASQIAYQATKNGQGFDLYNRELSTINNNVNALKNTESQLNSLAQYADYDPNALNIGLSQLEAESLGVQGGEGLYNILKEQGVDGLIKTATADKNKLVSADEQSQLARLQSIAQLAKDYGAEGSDVNVVNPFSNRDLAGQQTALSALDMDNFRDKLQGAEKAFRTDAAASTITGTGTGSGSSSGLFGKKRASATQSVSQNFGDILSQNNAYRNMYSDKGVNKDLLKQIMDTSRGSEDFNTGYTDPGIVGGVTDTAALPADMISGLIGTNQGTEKAALNLAMMANPATAPFALASLIGSKLGGSSAAAQGEANANAQAAAIENLRANITNKVNTSGLKNQLGVVNNAQRDAELFKLLGLLDTTNL